MKLKMSMLAGAFALAVAGQASAAIVDANAALGSDLILTVWNATTGVSYTRDLGVSSSAFIDQVTLNNPASPLPAFAPVAADSILSGILAGGTTGFQWNVTAANIATQTWLSTATTTASVATVASLQDANTIQGMNSQQGYYNAVNLALGTNSTATAFTVTGATKMGYNVAGSNWGGNSPFSNAGAVGSNLNFFFLTTTTGGPSITASNVLQYMNGATPMQFTLASNGNLSVAAVPEPGEWLLMLSGLCLLGFIATRRKGQGNSMTFA